jgi:hypothetical protein
MPFKKLKRVLTTIMCVLSIALSGTTDSNAADSQNRKKDRTYFFTAITQAPARIQGPVQTGEAVTWMCRGNVCTATRTGAAAYELSIGMCARLVRQVGPLVEYRNQKEVMRPDHLASCHKHGSIGAGVKEPLSVGQPHGAGGTR